MDTQPSIKAQWTAGGTGSEALRYLPQRCVIFIT